MNNILKSIVLAGVCVVGSIFPMGTASASVGSAGCGLGSLIISDNEWWLQVIAATINGTGIQTFGITSGTSNCATGVFGQIQKQKDYVTANLTSLQREGAQGAGDSLNGLASVLGCSDAQFASFGAYTQAHYSSVFNTNISDTVLDNVKKQLLKDSSLRAACPLASI